MARRTHMVPLCGALALLAGIADAAGPTKQACADAYLSGQQLRKQGKLVAARGELLICAQDGCPAAAKNDCVKWLAEVEQLTPSIVVTARGRDGADTAAVEVWIDGAKVADALDGRPIPLDPGPHSLRFEHQGMPIEREVVLVEGATRRSVEVSFAPESGSITPPPVPDDSAPADDGDGELIAAFVLGGVSLGAFATFAAFGVLGMQEHDDLEATCGPGAPPAQRGTCSDEQIGDAQTKLIVADVALGAGAACAVASLALFIHYFATAPDSAARFRPIVSPGTAAAEVEIRF